MKDVLVGLWSRDTHEPRKMLAHTIFPLSQAVRKTTEKAAALLKQKGNLETIFVAPEFLFTEVGDARANGTALTKKWRDVVLEKMTKLSQDNPKMLLVPGTIVFKEPITPQSAQRAIRNLRHAKDPKPINQQRKTPIKPYMSYEAPEQTTGSAQAYYQGQIDTLTPYEQSQMSVSPSLGTGFLIKNRTYVFFNGEKKFSYGKKCNMGDFDGDKERGIFVPGRHEGMTTIDGLAMGFEICLDHSLGTLKNHLASNNLDFHIIASAEVNNNAPHICVGEGGYLIHASANDKYSKVLRKMSVPQKKTNPSPLLSQKVTTQKPGQMADTTRFEVGDSSPQIQVGGDIKAALLEEERGYQVIQPVDTIQVDKGLLKFYLLEGVK